MLSALIFTAVMLSHTSAGAQSTGQKQAHLNARGDRVFGTLPRDDKAAANAFESIIPVLRHPRCMNCHSTGDFPRQGDDSHRHPMNVPRGPEGDGVAALKCSTCHQDHNVEGMHTPPGSPDWHLPAPKIPMIC